MVRYLAHPDHPDLQRALDELASSGRGGFRFVGCYWFVAYAFGLWVLASVLDGLLVNLDGKRPAVAALIIAGAMVGAYYKREFMILGEVRALYGKEVVSGEILFIDADVWRKYERHLRRTGQPYDGHKLFRWQERANIDCVGRELERYLRNN